MPKIFIISKPIKFDRKNIPIPGQTDPETDGWNLILLDTGNHSEEIVFSGFYRHCKDLQQLYTNKPSGDFSGEIAGMQKRPSPYAPEHRQFFAELCCGGKRTARHSQHNRAVLPHHFFLASTPFIDRIAFITLLIQDECPTPSSIVRLIFVNPIFPNHSTAMSVCPSIPGFVFP